jgi:hypothetical protein
MNRRILPFVTTLLAGGVSGCALISGADCLSRQQRAPVTTITGDAAPATVVVHEVVYGTAGSQNDLRINWVGKNDAGGPRLRVYATKVECDQFDPAVVLPRADDCGRISGIFSTVSVDARPCARNNTCTPTAEELVQHGLIISHGRGNPEQLAPTGRYKLWIFADPRQATSYTIDITSFYGPDC